MNCTNQNLLHAHASEIGIAGKTIAASRIHQLLNSAIPGYISVTDCPEIKIRNSEGSTTPEITS